jgi:hypothetical protein
MIVAITQLLIVISSKNSQLIKNFFNLIISYLSLPPVMKYTNGVNTFTKMNNTVTAPRASMKSIIPIGLLTKNNKTFIINNAMIESVITETHSLNELINLCLIRLVAFLGFQITLHPRLFHTCQNDGLYASYDTLLLKQHTLDP